MKLREYQMTAVSQVREAIISGNKHICMVSPTGSGKSLIIAEIISLAHQKGKVILWLVHRRNLVTQMQTTLRQFGIEPGIIMSGVESDTSQPIQLGTYQTYQRRLKLEDLDTNAFFIKADVLIIDECHRSVSKGYLDIVDLYREKIVIGCTATAMRADSRPLGSVYDTIVDVASVKYLTDQGFLAPVRYFVPTDVDLGQIKVVRGDYDTKQLDEKFNKKKIVGDIVENWLRVAENRQTIIFCINVKHSRAVCDAFLRHGIAAEHLDARSTDEEREGAFQRMEMGDLTVLCNVALYQEGMDCPDLSCVVMARSTKSLGLYRQCCGRGLRPKKNGGDVIIIDHGGVVEEHGLLDEEVIWSLEGEEKAWRKPKKKEGKEPKMMKCTFCDMVFCGLKECPACGSPVKSFWKKVEVVESDLVELVKKKKTQTDKRRFLGMLRAWVPRQRNSNPKRVLGAFKGRFGVWPGPKYKNVSPIEPDKEFLNYMRYMAIKYAKSKRA